MEIYYSDMCQVVTRPYDAKLIFGIVDPEHIGGDQPEIKKLAAVYMSLTQAKTVLKVLEHSINQHEKKVGKIELPNNFNLNPKTLQ